jgi:hypothetical protein
MESYRRTLLLELSLYLFSKSTNFVADDDLASIILHKSRRENSKKWPWTDKQVTPEVTKRTLITYCTSTPTHPYVGEALVK